jgi:hypothetical protein
MLRAYTTMSAITILISLYRFEAIWKLKSEVNMAGSRAECMIAEIVWELFHNSWETIFISVSILCSEQSGKTIELAI